MCLFHLQRLLLKQSVVFHLLKWKPCYNNKSRSTGASLTVLYNDVLREGLKKCFNVKIYLNEKRVIFALSELELYFERK